MKRVVITGAGGFVGSRLVQHYRDIWDITPLDHSRLELTDREAVHAALAGVRPRWASPPPRRRTPGPF